MPARQTMSSTRAAVRQYALAGERGPTQENAVPTALTRYVVSRLEQVPSFHTGAAKFTLLFDWKPVPEPCFKRRAGDFLPDLSRYFFSGLHQYDPGPRRSKATTPLHNHVCKPPRFAPSSDGSPLTPFHTITAQTHTTPPAQGRPFFRLFWRRVGLSFVLSPANFH